MFSDRLKKIKFRLLGPTVAHLEHEVYILCCMILLLIGSLCGLYKESFGFSSGDYKFIVLVFLTLSRHLLVRLFSTWDPSTHASPTITGCISHFIQTTMTFGQTFDRPVPPIQLSILHNHTTLSGIGGGGGGSSSGERTISGTTTSAVANTTSSSPSMSATDRMIQIIGGYLETKDATTSWTQLLPSSVVYAMQIPRKLLWFPFTRLFGTPQFSYNTINTDDSNIDELRRVHNVDQTILGSLQQKYKSIQQYFIQLWLLYGPSLHFLLSTKICSEILWHSLYLLNETPPWLLVDGNMIRGRMTNLFINTHDVKRMQQVANKESVQMVGTYIQQHTPKTSDVIWILVGFGTLYSLLVFSRIVYPLPDLLSGSGSVVTREVRSNNISNSGSGGKRTNRNSNISWFSRISGHFKEWINSNALTSSTESAMATERQNPNTSTNRLHICLYTIVGRVLENVVVVGILPRTKFACRAMGHCSSGPTLWELSRVLYPGGLNTPKRMDVNESSQAMETDAFSALSTLIAVSIISTVLLLAQTLVLNRSYLSTSAYHSLEWELLSKETKKGQRQSDDSDLPWLSSSQHQSTPDVWDARRKYVKGDQVYYPDWFGALYRARVNSPEGHPKSNRFRAIDEELLSELGHPATSRILASLASIQFLISVVYFLMWILFVLCGYYQYFEGLIWTVISCFLAVQGVLSTTKRAAYSSISKNGHRQSSNFRQQLHVLNNEIMKHNT